MAEGKRLARALLTIFLILISCSAMAEASIIALLNTDWPYPPLQSYEEALKAGADPNEKDGAGKTALILAIWNNKNEVCEVLLNNGADANLAGPASETPLMFAVRRNDNNLVQKLLNAGADPNAVNAHGNSVLSNASEHTDLNIVDLLVEKGASSRFIGKNIDPDAKDDKGTPLLIQAILAHELASVRYLLRSGAKINCRDAEGSTPLIRAFYSFRRAAPLLMKHGADVTLADNWQRTPLHIAAKNDDTSLLSLIEAGANIEAVASGSYTPLMYAFSGKYPENAALLLEHGANIKAKDDLGREPLHFACLTQNLAGIYFAVEAGAEIDSRDSTGNTPLLTAFREMVSRETVCEIVDYLLAKGADINALADDGKGVLQLAERSHDPLLLKALVERGARLSYPDSISATAKDAAARFLLQAIKEDRLVLAEFLASTLSASETAAKTDLGETALHLAVDRNNDSLLQTLLKQGFDPNMPRNDGATPLHIAIRRCNKELVPHLLRAGARPDIADQKGETALTCADRSGDSALYELLINFSQRDPAEANALSAANASETSLLSAIKNNRRLTIERLLKGSPNVAERDENGDTPLHFSISRYSREWANTLINAGADPAATNNEGTTPLHIAAREGNLHLTRLFLDRGVPVDVIDARGRTPLYLAVKGKHLLVLELLLQRGADINKGDKNGRTALFEALNIDPYLITFSWLVKRGAKVNAVDRHGNTIFHEVITSSTTKWTVDKLLGLGLDPLQMNNQGESPLSIGLRRGSPEIVDYMFAKKPDFSAMASKGASILHGWAMDGNTELLSRAIANGADPNLIDRKGEPLLFATLNTPVASVAKLLIAAGANVECKTASGVTLLEKAVQKGRIETVRSLLKAGADPNRSGSEGIPPIWLAVGCWEIFSMLLEQGARPDLALLNDERLNPTRKTLLETPEGVSALRRLIDRGADLRPLVFPGDTPETKNKQVFGWAWMGYVDSVKLAIDLGFDLKTTDERGYTLLHWAARRGMKDLVRKLVEWGAPLEAMSQKNETPLSFALEGNLHDAIVTLLEAGAATKALEKRPGASPLHEAAYAEADPKILDHLINHGHAVNSLDSGGGTPLLWAVEGCAAEAASHLLDLGADPNIATVVATFSAEDKNNSIDRSNLYEWNVSMLKWKMSGITPLARAVVKKSQPITLKLLEHGARTDIADDLGNTPLHLAFIANEPGLAELMLDYNPQILARNLDGKTPIELADEKGFTDAAFALWKKVPSSLKHDPNENSQPASTPFPLHDAVRQGETTRLRWLFRQGSRHYVLDADKHTPLWVAVDDNRLNAAKILLQHGASPDYATRTNDSPWIFAVKNGKTDFVEAMASAGVDINLADKSGDTALHIAARSLDLDLIELLLRLNASPGACNNLGRTPLMEAIVQSKPSAALTRFEARLAETNAKLLRIKQKAQKSKRWNPLKKLLKIDTRSAHTRVIEALAVKDPAIMVADIYGQTVLHLAARNSNPEIVKLLVSIGSELEARDRNGRTPIYHAIITGNSEALEELIKLGSAVDTADNRGETPLSLTDALNSVELRELLRQAGAPAESIVPRWPENSSQLQTGLIRAVVENRPEAVRYLLDHGNRPGEADSAGDTPLFHAVRACNPLMVELLLKNGADQAQLNSSGQKPLDLAISLSRSHVRGLIPDDDTRTEVPAPEQQQNWIRIIELLTSGKVAEEKAIEKKPEN